MPSITSVDFYFAVDDGNGYPIIENRTWTELTSASGVSFSIDSSNQMAAEISKNHDSDHVLHIFNVLTPGGFLLGIRYNYDDGSIGWINNILQKDSSSQYLDTIIGGWMANKTMNEIMLSPEWKGTPMLGNSNGWVIVEIKRIDPPTCGLTLSPTNQTIYTTEEGIFSINDTNRLDAIDYEIAVSPNFIGNVIKDLNNDELIFQPTGEGDYVIEVTGYYTTRRTCTTQITLKVEDLGECIYAFKNNTKTAYQQEEVQFSLKDTTGVNQIEWEIPSDLTIIETNNAYAKIKTSFENIGNIYTITANITRQDGKLCMATGTLEIIPDPCVLTITPESQKVIANQEIAVFTVSHAYNEEGNWIYDSMLEDACLTKTNTTIEFKPNLSHLGTYDIRYQINNGTQLCEVTAKLIISEKIPEIPPLPNTPPEAINKEENEIQTEKVMPFNIKYDQPHMILRNARYRGPRESEKYLNSHQEQIYDIRQNWKKINNLMKEQKIEILKWQKGESSKSSSIFTITGEKEMPVTSDQTIYHLVDTIKIRKIHNVMVKLDTVPVSSEHYELIHNAVVIDINTIDLNTMPSTITIHYEIDVEINEEDYQIGLNKIKDRIIALSERLTEAERRYCLYENAYK